MFLASIREDGLLPPEPGSFVLEKLPTVSKRVVCAGIVDALREATDAGQIDSLISSQESVSWHLQVLGSAFTLPFDAPDDINVAQGALELMIGWLAPNVDVDVPAAPSARAIHPREEHLAPLFVTVGAAEDDPGEQIFSDVVLNLAMSGYAFG